MKVKICGIKDVETARYAIERGADAVGFVFAKSKRKVTSEEARMLVDSLPVHVLKVGVFVNEALEVVQEIIAQTGINVVQLHGDESPQYCRQLAVPVIKAFSIESREDLQKIHEFDCDYALLDSPKGKYRGGNGIKFDWSLLSQFDRRGKKIILAGGLDPNNVDDAIKEVLPYMVDVSSGVETDGKKDFAKIETFLSKAKNREEVK
ncbi:phosphoribosylanthranilate isomerase [Robertmurraya massiliosenegalensis]|uniref:phosphoribosylanthranilate isomerase n=1 Tax=Robertmurraya massiliosenegalensis TaxID=1287657 RepID=UPI0002FD5F76|nr:phosphoribosylanthranilate isomerase [Robertmurraya massiliosenegalensis]